ncbi:MAG: site-specific integrase [Candidatus Dormibacteraceae bacterium]
MPGLGDARRLVIGGRLLVLSLLSGAVPSRAAQATPDLGTSYRSETSDGAISEDRPIHAGVLRTALGQAQRWGLVARNVAELVDGPRVERHEIRPFDPAEARAFLAAVATDRLSALYSVAFTMGLRQGEALGLRWMDVDLETGTLHVRHQLQRIDGNLQLVPLKTTRSRRTLALPESITTGLRAHRLSQLKERLLAGKTWKGLEPSDGACHVFATPIGTPLDARNVVRQFKELLRLAGLREIRFHDFRHSCATLLLAQGVSARVVMETLGHSQIALTLNTYTAVVPELGREAARRMDALLID